MSAPNFYSVPAPAGESFAFSLRDKFIISFLLHLQEHFMKSRKIKNARQLKNFPFEAVLSVGGLS